VANRVSLPKELAGVEGHLKMAPLYRVEQMRKGEFPPLDAKRSAVLVLLTPPKNGELALPLSLEWSLLLIKRSSYIGTHSAEMAFPGGKSEPGDKNFIETACREANEELGVERSKIEIIGSLTELFIPPSNFIIYPIVAIDKGVGELKPNSTEVKFFTQVELSTLNPQNAKIYNIETPSNGVVRAPGYLVGGHIVWGATAMIISELYLAIASSTAEGVIGNL